ncbi:class I SAM-dependent methyltransferase [Sphingomonas sp. GCM10030256]|uniref:class I SAM-dependent methyltransferase n=1 Tax=Sphingomonas sp. GCM10030256 TaxID=3273427 RepID=UPI00361E95D9
MSTDDTGFAGSIPAIYDRHLGPFLFRPFAEEVAQRAGRWKPRSILETAAGTGLATEALAEACPDAEIVATDLNQAMLDVARTRLPPRVELQPADAQALPFPDARFDLVVCQFGIMFMPDKVAANREARPVPGDGGHYVLAVWNRLEENPASRIVHEAVASLSPENPPAFLARTPFGYSDPARIEHDLLAAGFTDVEFETVKLRALPEAEANDAAVGLVCGSPLRTEIEAFGPDALDWATEAAREAFRAAGEFDPRLSAHIVTAIR